MIENCYKKNDKVYLDPSIYEQPKEYFKSIVEKIRDVFAATPFSIVDVGCASGAFLHYAKSKLSLSKIAGIEISSEHLKQARKVLPEAEFILSSIETPKNKLSQTFDVCTFLGTMSIFDEIDIVLSNLMALVGPGGHLWICDLINDYPVDVIVRYRFSDEKKAGDWCSGLNIRSLSTYRRALDRCSPMANLNISDFELPFPLPQKEDPLRSWTIQTEYKRHQLVVGTGQLLNFKIIHIEKSL